MKTTGHVAPAPTIPPVDRCARRIAPPTRAQLRSLPATPLRDSRPRKADVYRVRVGDVDVVVKDFADKAAPWRAFGRIQLRRELAAYRRLADVAGLPRCFGAVDRDALAFEWIPGAPLKTLPDRVEGGADYVAQLETIVAEIHAAGVAHLDLRSNNNVVVRQDGRVFVVDLASAVVATPGSVPHRFVVERLAALDRSGVLKWRQCLVPDSLTAEDRRRLKRHRSLSALWLVNPKQKADQNAEPSTGSDGA